VSDLGAFARLIGMGWRLARADALIPREFEPYLPAGAVALGRAMRIFAGPQARQGRPGARLARVLEISGPVAIKLGQFLATRADIFGEAFADDLAHLRDRLPPFPDDVARAEIAATLGRPLDSLFSEVGPAVAAASIAQAHSATLLDGTPVAVKVLRPNIELQVARDSAVLALAARLVVILIPAARRLEPSAFAETVIRALRLELDLRFEAAGAAELAEIMAKDGHMQGPAVVWDGVGRRALTLTWATGTPLSDPAALNLPGLDRPALAGALTRGFLAQALDHGLFHADLHEGNLFVAAPATLTAVDFGILGRLGPMERRYLAEILWGFLNRDYRRVAALHFEAGYVPAHHDVHAFAQALRLSANRCLAATPAACRWAGCWRSCSRSPRCSTCTCAPNWCCCKRPWSRSRASPAASTPATTCGPPPIPSSAAGSPVSSRRRPRCRPCSRTPTTPWPAWLAWLAPRARRRPWSWRRSRTRRP
jgi:ubiquinone biosynthesis protein